jgi:4'-phosphopantetheinyl transferase
MKELDENAVVWIARLSESREAVSMLDALLDDSERERAGRFRFPDDRARFTIGRAMARKALGHFLQREPASISFTRTERGRPVLPRHELAFNISHARDFIAVGVAKDARVGIDIECVDRKIDLMGLVERILSERDFRAFATLPEEEKLAAFFRVWTRKEAYLKARGEGISEGLQSITVSFGADAISTITDTRDEAGAAKWRLHALPVPDDYQGCVACDDPRKKIAVEWV